jgi:NAD+ kinase
MIGLDLRIDRQPGPSLTGDGVIISTPVGSTAYNVSAGGPIVSPDLEGIIITPLAAHSLSFRPIIAPPSSRIDITVTRANPPRDSRPPDGGRAPAPAEPRPGTTLVLDGQELVPLHEGDRVSLCTHARRAAFVPNPDANYWRTLIQKMHWAAAPGESPTAHR